MTKIVIVGICVLLLIGMVVLDACISRDLNRRSDDKDEKK